MAENAPGGRLAILAGGGDMPRLVADAVAASGRQTLIAAIAGFFNSDPGPHEMVTFSAGEVGGLFAALRKYGCRDVVMVGEMKRPRLRDLRIDWGGMKRLPLLFKVRSRGDDAALRLLTQTFEEAGFRIVALNEVAPSLAAPPGMIGANEPGPAACAAIAFGFSLLNALSAFDVGQAVVVHRRRVLAVEGAEGTNAMIARIADLRSSGRFEVKPPSGILVKMPKANQELRNDMPVIGAETVAAAARAGLEGIAIAAGGVALADRAQLGQLADEARMFLVGCDGNGRWSGV